MKLLHVLHHCVTQVADGYATRSHAILRAQQASGIEVVGLTGAQNDGGTADGDTIVDGVRYAMTPGSRLRDIGGVREVRKFQLLKGSLYRLCNREQPDIIHVHSPVYNAFAALRVASAARRPVIYEVRAMWEDAAADQRRLSPQSWRYGIAQRAETSACRRCTAITTICEGLRQELVSRGVHQNKIIVAPNAVDAGRFRPSPRDEAMAASLQLGQGPVFGFIGSLFGYEGVEDLLDCVDDVLKRAPTARFVIVGSGERQREVEERAARYSGGEVVYRPRIPFDEVQRMYSLIDCFVYARRRNRLTDLVTPLKPLEAMAMEKAVIASDVGGHRELISHGNTGLLFRAGDRDALVRALCEIGKSTEKRVTLGRAARAYILNTRTWRHVSRVYVALYDEVLKRREGKA